MNIRLGMEVFHGRQKGTVKAKTNSGVFVLFKVEFRDGSFKWLLARELEEA